MITLCSAIISVPTGIFAAIYLVEYGKGNRLARGITTGSLIEYTNKEVLEEALTGRQRL